ncbi:MAG: DNA replication/repair protein RecF [Oscillospiraceae bacterium]|jgi:DNA replication and repair protein RecF|nr:DNA replication/repair protein RecF [Oscillospiraceae bacterium]
MEIQSISLTHFRNYDRATAHFSPKCNLIFGENAQGKTNLLEAAAYLSGAKSHRTRGDKELIQFGHDTASLQASVWSRNRSFSIDITLSRQGRRKILIEGIKQKTTASLSDVLRTVLFSPEDLSLIWAGASARRRFLDQSLCQLRPRYAEALAQYNRIYEHKTRILRDWEQKPSLLSLLETFNLDMARYGAVLVSYRARYLRKLQELFGSYHSACSGGVERPNLIYETVSTVQDLHAPQDQIYQWLLEHQKSHHQAELAARCCLSGPHKDDFTVSLSGRALKSFGSQGQVRTAALALKLAEREMHFLDRGEYPVLFLDDVMSELDEKRQSFVLHQITEGQVFITCCQTMPFSDQFCGAQFQIEQGTIREAEVS